MAKRAKVNGILVLSGEANMHDIEVSPQVPDLVVNSVNDLAR
jgi:ribonucleotide monophosphatase NagD (HAD superfamily)